MSSPSRPLDHISEASISHETPMGSHLNGSGNKTPDMATAHEVLETEAGNPRNQEKGVHDIPEMDSGHDKTDSLVTESDDIH